METTPKKIMIVEDEALIAADIEQRLIGLGYQVPAVADSAVTALGLIEKHRPDLLLVDIRIRGSIDGIALANHVKQEFRLPVVFLTAHADSATLQRAKAAEPFGYLVKPVGAATLPSTIEIALYKHKMEQELRSQRAWLETTLRSIGDGVVVAGPDETVRYINDAALEILGSTRDGALNKRLEKVLRLRFDSSGLPVEDLTAISTAEDRPMPLPPEVHLIASERRRVPIEGSIAPCRLGDDCYGSVILFRDVALRQAAEREQRDEQKMIAVGRLAAGVASGLDGLDAAIKRSIAALEDSASPGAAQADLRVAAAAAAALGGRLRPLVRQKGVGLESLDVRSFIQTQLAGLSRCVPDEVTISARLEEEEDATVHAAPAHLSQILSNVVANAGEAMPGGGSIFIETSREDRSPASDSVRGDYVRIAVRDDGPGMAAEAMDNLFEPFFSTKRNGDCAGLGLAAVHSTVSMLGGFVAVDSKPGAGTTVEIFLPAAVSAAPADLPQWPTVLLVEESEPLRRLLHNYLEAHDLNLLEAAGAVDALDLAEVFEGAIDLLVADASSADLAAQLKAARPEMKVLFAANAEAEARKIAGAEWLARPIRKAELLDKVERMLG